MVMKLEDEIFLNVNFNNDVLAKLQEMPGDKASEIVASAFDKPAECEIRIRNDVFTIQSNFYQVCKLFCWFGYSVGAIDRLQEKLHLNPGDTLLHNVDKVLSSETKKRFMSEPVLCKSITRRNNSDVMDVSDEYVKYKMNFDDLVDSGKFFDFLVFQKSFPKIINGAVVAMEARSMEVTFRDMYETMSCKDRKFECLAIYYSELVSRKINFFPESKDSERLVDSLIRLKNQEDIFLKTVTDKDVSVFNEIIKSGGGDSSIPQKISQKLIKDRIDPIPLTQSDELVGDLLDLGSKTSFKM